MLICSMALVSIRKHPDYAHFESDEKVKVQKNTAKAVDYAEKLKPKVMARFESEAALEEEKRIAAEQNQVLPSSLRSAFLLAVVLKREVSMLKSSIRFGARGKPLTEKNSTCLALCHSTFLCNLLFLKRNFDFRLD